MTITAAADGSALGNPGPAGWAWYVDDSCWAAGGWKHATNNQGELKAVLELFRATAHLDDDLLVLCDSQYVINSVTKWMRGWKSNGWRKRDGKPVLNLELLKELDEALAGRKYHFEWVKGHIGHPLNEAADVCARAVAEAYQQGRPIPAGPGFIRARNAAGADGADVASAESESAAPTVESAASAGVVAAASASPSGGAPGQPELFSFDEEPELHTVTLSLSADEHANLVRRAREVGVGVEELLRILVSELPRR